MTTPIAVDPWSTPPPSPPPPARPRRGRLVLLTAAGALLVAIASVGAYAYLRDSPAPAPGPGQAVGAAPMTTTAARTMSEKAACTRAALALPDAVALVAAAAAHPDGTGIDLVKLGHTRSELRAVQSSMPGSLTADVGDVLATLDQLDQVLTHGGSATLDGVQIRSRVPGIILACGPYIQ